MRRNPFRLLNDLPDEPRLGVRLVVMGFLIMTVRYEWPRVAPASFQRASEFLFLHSTYLVRRPSIDELGVFILIGGLFCMISGAFIFFRRGFWWVAEHRKDNNITELKFK